MPRSVVIYTSAATLSALRESIRLRFGHERTKPYTLSYDQKTDAGKGRLRLCELVDDALLPMISDLVAKGEATFGGPSDRDVGSRSYEELLEDADRRRRVALLQFSTPVIVEVSRAPVPFPVMPAIFEGYVSAWRAFSGVAIPSGFEGLRHVSMTGFKVSCVVTPFGPGAQGWVRLEMDKGRTEAEIALFNGLIDFAFFCGSGLHTEEGLGQTRRIEQREG